MQIIKYYDDKLRQNVSNGYKYFENINISDINELRILDKFSLLNLDNELLKVLKTFNKQIINVNTKTSQYTIDFYGEQKILGLHRLSSGEKLFVICFAADKTKTPIIVQNELEQLDLKHIKMFFELWSNSYYINISVIKTHNIHTYNRLLEENK